jgi:predicted  nucleic acid-binding Zn-ribbon protein
MTEESRSGASQREPGEGVLIQVCLECGREYMFEDSPPPERLTCEKCGSTVFRSFYASTSEDEAEADFRDATERDLAPDDAETDATEADVLDLNNL